MAGPHHYKITCNVQGAVSCFFVAGGETQALQTVITYATEQKLVSNFEKLNVSSKDWPTVFSCVIKTADLHFPDAFPRIRSSVASMAGVKPDDVVVFSFPLTAKNIEVVKIEEFTK